MTLLEQGEGCGHGGGALCEDLHANGPVDFMRIFPMAKHPDSWLESAVQGMLFKGKAIMKTRYLPWNLIGATAVLGAAMMFGAVTQAQGSQGAGTFAPESGRYLTHLCRNTQFLEDQQAFENGQIVADQPEDICGKVVSVLPEKKTRSGNHGYFYIEVAPGVDIEIVSDLDQMNAPQWPWVSVGDTTYVQGRYYFDNMDSQGVDWTHHGTSKSWPHAGYVVVNGKEYQ